MNIKTKEERLYMLILKIINVNICHLLFMYIFILLFWRILVDSISYKYMKVDKSSEYANIYYTIYIIYSLVSKLHKICFLKASTKIVSKNHILYIYMYICYLR